MTTAFDISKLPSRSYGMVMAPHEMLNSASKVPAEAVSGSARVELVLRALAVSEEGYTNSSLLRIALGALTGSQLTMVEESLVALHKQQRQYEVGYGKFNGTKRPYSSIMVSLSNQPPAPYDFVASLLLNDFDEVAFIALSKFAAVHTNLKELVLLCTIMDRQGIALTQRNVAVQIIAMNELLRTQRNFWHDVHPYLSHADMISAVHKYPRKIIELVKMLTERGSVAAADEVFGSSTAISEGAL